MHKKCKEILEHLEKDKKIKISSYKFPEKEELKLRLKDLLEEKVDEKYYLSDEKIKRISNWESHQKPFEKVQGRNSIVPTLTARGAGEEHSGMIIYSDKLEKTTNLQNKLLSRDYKEPKCIQVGSLTGEKWDKMHDISKRVSSSEGISPTIHVCGGGNTEPKVTESDSNFILGPMQNHASINRDGIAPTLTSAMGESGGHVPMHNYDFRIRKLTPKECWRLMDFDDEDFEKASKINSNTQLYKQAGNSIVVNVLAKIISNLGVYNDN